MSLLQTYQHVGEGYNPFLVGPRWQVAQLNYSVGEALESKSWLDIHYLTDEAFLLIEGVAILVAAEIDDTEIKYEISRMLPGVTYNIPKMVWHTIVLEAGTKVLIVEDANTHLPLPEGDYEFYHFSEVQKAEFKQKILNVLNQM